MRKQKKESNETKIEDTISKEEVVSISVDQEGIVVRNFMKELDNAKIDGTRKTSKMDESQVEGMEDLEEELTKLEKHRQESELMEKEAGNKSKEKKIMNLSDSQGQWVQEGEKEELFFSFILRWCQT